MPKRSTLRLTTRFVNALRTDGKDAFFWDHELAGFGVRVQKNGRKVYVVQSRGPAGLKRVTLGPCAELPMGERGARPRRSSIASSRARSRCRRRRSRIGDLARRYLEEHVAVHCKPKSAAHGAQRRQPPHRTGPWQAPAGSGRAQARHGSAREAL